ncbi:malto-oligosyltrehalose synthase [Stakelama saccharophila]|uniref:Malto-oligosyltrehalose synthase n=1 Tax=Stakelama saccharophila TaxID=3075605 RepID=A0ABZ0B8Q1_9SPHN|nr:malto-oligosyltrehalose synthase [Stakelama sp. W311]WNO53655.1 malto-oligosyltrehalose synthase [Stakelama sp. W311]
MIPRATYRLQFHKGFTFADAEALIPYLHNLGISHLYASPITTARRGSMHGYDVADPTRINPEIGGEAGFRSLVAALRSHGMGVIVDIVPNHMGVAGGDNPWWNDVLRHGRASAYADFFDIDWRHKVMLPILGAPLDEVIAAGEIGVDASGAEPVLSVYGEHRVPIRPADHAIASAVESHAEIAALLDRQHYRLVWWRVANDELNWRRFFTINDLAGLRAEDERVFEATHALYFRLYEEGLIDGVRVDHIDGLTDPAGYCRRLRERFAATGERTDAARGHAYIVVEKILAPGEMLPPDWPVDGTSGYDFMADVTALLNEPAGEPPLTRLWDEMARDADTFAAVERTARREMLSWAFAGQLDGCVEAFVALARSNGETHALTPHMLRRAIERALWAFPVYRTYGTGTGAPPGDGSVRNRVRERAAPYSAPGERGVLDRLLDWLAGEGPGDPALAAEAVRRFQQLAAPIAAKAVEDTAFYRYGRLLSLNDVGGDPGRFALSPDDFLRTVARRAEQHANAMLATATHDHKRGEDTRARFAVLSAMPEAWRCAVADWDSLAHGADSGIHPADRYMLYQTLLGAFPPGPSERNAEVLADFAERVVGWQVKALREAKRRSSWAAPDEAYEARCTTFVRSLLDPQCSGGFLSSLDAFLRRIHAPAMANSLAQTGLRYLLPGVPDCYQGAELLDLSLVDPDNRRPVDFDLRRAVLDGDSNAPGARKLALIRTLLALRRDCPMLFNGGPIKRTSVKGERKDHILAWTCRHGDRVLFAAVAIRLAPALADTDNCTPEPAWWADTAILAPGDRWIAAADCFADSPVSASIISARS